MVPVVKRLLRDSEKALDVKPQSVTDKEQVPPSGDKHDYMTQAPYWWPDPKKPNGLPYIRRDGERKDREQRQDRHARQQRIDRQKQRTDRGEKGGRRDRPPRRERDRVERAEREQYYAKPFGGRQNRQNKEPDPNSPFAKLAALKQQLEQNKEP